MRIIRYQKTNGSKQLAAVTEDSAIYPLPYKDFLALIEQAETHKVSCLSLVMQTVNRSQPIEKHLEDLTLLVPIDAYEVWASGVTYRRSKDARNFEAKTTSESFYDKVYTAERPELFLKSTSRRTVGPHTPIYLRTDSHWQVPEPELGLVLNRKGEILGYTIGNDLSSRDIEGENPLYLSQAKIWRNSCAIGPAIRLAETVDDPYRLSIFCRIYRKGRKVFEDWGSTSQLERQYDELVSYLMKDNVIFNGTVLLTGTCIVPDNDFTLREGDQVEIEIPEIGILVNPVKEQ
ncbi:MAG: fumarylacetoacetate hydrolase family protein [Novibacillus thermophilus]